MFEQSLYQAEPVVTPTGHGDLFHEYEIKNWELSPRIYKILGAAAVVNVLALIVFAQTSLLTMKGCDSPLVGRVCQVLDTVYVGSLLFGTDREYIDAAYDKTDLGDAEITFVDVTGVAPPLSYPEGYFQLANPVQYQAMLDAANDPTLNGGFPPGVTVTTPTTGGTSIFDTPASPAKQNPTVVEGTLPQDFGTGTDVNPTLNGGKPRRGGRIKTPSDGLVAGTTDPKPDPPQKVDPTDPITDVEINKRPFVDVGNYINGLLDKNQVKLETPFLINATGKLNKDGKLDAKSFRFIKAESPDPKMIEVVKEAIEALNESGYLQYLSMLAGKSLAFEIKQDELNVSATIQSEFENDLRPKTVSTLLNAFIDGKRKAKASAEADQNDKDDLVLLQNAVATPVGKKVLITFNIPKADLQQMIQRKLAEQKQQPQGPNGSSIAKPGDNTAER
jgi:hypothetical protein